MSLRDAVSERMVALVLLFVLLGIISILALIMLSGPGTKDPLTVGLFSSLIAGLLSSLGAVVNSVFRTDRTEQQRAATQDTAVQAMAASMPSALPPGAPPAAPSPSIEVTGLGGGAVLTEEATT